MLGRINRYRYIIEHYRYTTQVYISTSIYIYTNIAHRSPGVGRVEQGQFRRKSQWMLGRGSATRKGSAARPPRGPFG